MKKILTSILLFLISISIVFGQERPMHEIYSAMIYNFIKYIEWPSSDDTDFVVGIYGDSELFNTFNTYYNGKPKGNKKHKVVEIKSLADIKNCQVIYISKTKLKDFDAIMSQVANKDVLIVTSQNGYGDKGSSINMVTTSANKLIFEINTKSSNNQNLKISNSLTSIGKIIN